MLAKNREEKGCPWHCHVRVPRTFCVFNFRLRAILSRFLHALSFPMMYRTLYEVMFSMGPVPGANSCFLLSFCDFLPACVRATYIPVNRVVLLLVFSNFLFIIILFLFTFQVHLKCTCTLACMSVCHLITRLLTACLVCACRLHACQLCCVFFLSFFSLLL